jgi:hypothetical protein
MVTKLYLLSPHASNAACSVFLLHPSDRARYGSCSPPPRTGGHIDTTSQHLRIRGINCVQEWAAHSTVTQQCVATCWKSAYAFERSFLSRSAKFVSSIMQQMGPPLCFCESSAHQSFVASANVVLIRGSMSSYSRLCAPWISTTASQGADFTVHHLIIELLPCPGGEMNAQRLPRRIEQGWSCGGRASIPSLSTQRNGVSTGLAPGIFYLHTCKNFTHRCRPCLHNWIVQAAGMPLSCNEKRRWRSI